MTAKIYAHADRARHGRPIGWAVAAVAWRDTDERLNVRLRPFTVGVDKATTADEAEVYVRDKMAELWSPDVGWHILVSAMAVYPALDDGTEIEGEHHD